jgi:NADH-quinone oxidoreductase subunit M
MLLSLLIIIPFFSGVCAVIFYKLNRNIPRWISLIGILCAFFISIKIFFQKYCYIVRVFDDAHDNIQFNIPWIPKFGIDFNIAIDGLSIVMLIFTFSLSLIAILSAWSEIKKHEGFFYFNFMLALTCVIGLFISSDLFLFFFFWEVMLIPMYFLIALWGNDIQKERSHCAAKKFFIYGQISGLILLSSILLLVFTCYQNTNILTFNYHFLLNQEINKNIEYIIMLGFFLAFAIKMPIFPFHGWLSEVHVQSTYCGAVEIIGVLLKTAPYALLRYNLALFPHATKDFALIAMCLGLISIFYGAWIAFSQNNIKKLIAYSSISHMGLILIGIYSNNEIALQGVLIQILSNSLSNVALCILSGQLYKQLQTYDIRKMGGLWSNIYWVPGFALFFSLSNLSIPGTGNFIGEFLVLSGIFHDFPMICFFATISIVFSSIYSLNIIKKIFYGVPKKSEIIFSIDQKDILTIIVLIFMVIFLGIYPQNIINISHDFIHSVHNEFRNSILK